MKIPSPVAPQSEEYNKKGPSTTNTTTTATTTTTTLPGSRPFLLVTVAPGSDAAPATLNSLKFAEAAMASSLLPPDPATPRGLQQLVGQLQRQVRNRRPYYPLPFLQLAHVTATTGASAALQAVERKRFEDEISQLRAQAALARSQ